MHTSSCSVLLALALVSAAAAGEGGKRLFILAGQSNMQRLDPEVSFTPAVKAAFGDGNVVVVKDAESGQPIRRWYKGWKPAAGEGPKATGDLYDRLMAKVRAAMASNTFDTLTLVWMQGESDAVATQGLVYAASLKGLIAQFEKDLGRNDLYVVIGRISDYQMSPDWERVRAAQVAVAESSSRYAWVDTDDLNGPLNLLHYDPAGFKALGQRMAEKAVALIKGAQKGPPPA